MKNTIAYSITGDRSAYHLGWVVSLVHADNGKLASPETGVKYPAMFGEPLNG